MAQNDWFESWFSSPYYHVLYENRDDLEAQDFVSHLLKQLHPLKGSRMLDIACGEGRFAKQLAGRGFEVTGIDLSHASIDKAKQYENDNLHFLVHDMRFPFYINYFDFAFNFFTSFGYFQRHRDHVMAARSFAGALKRDGILMLDYLNRDHAIINLVPEETVQHDGLTFNLKRRVEGGFIIKDISFTDHEGRQRHFTERVAAFGLSDFVPLFKKAGLTLVGTYGDYKLGAYNPIESPRLIMVFKK